VRAILGSLVVVAGCSAAQTVPAEQLMHRVPISAAREYQASTSALGSRNLAQAIAHCRKALETDPENAAAHNDLGVLYLNQGIVEKARAEFERATTIQPRLTIAHVNASFALLALERPTEAESSARRALDLAPADRRANLLLGWSLAAQNKYTDTSLISLRLAAREYPEAHLAAADVLVHRGSFTEARGEVEAYLGSDGAAQRSLAKAWLDFLTIK
jgi:Tfp pilus assembly protein PilF